MKGRTKEIKRILADLAPAIDSEWQFRREPQEHKFGFVSIRTSVWRRRRASQLAWLWRSGTEEERKKAARSLWLRSRALLLAENPKVSEEMIRQLAGHVSPRMLARYAHIRAQARRDAIATLERSEVAEFEAESPQNPPQSADSSETLPN